MEEANRQKSVLTPVHFVTGQADRYYRISIFCKAYMRHDCSGKQAHFDKLSASHHCKAQRTPKGQLCRYDRNRLKDKALTRGSLHVHELDKWSSQQKS